MSENFLSRWARLKQQSGAQARKPSPPSPEIPTASPADAPTLEVAKPESPQFDPTTLPSLESIAADTDIRDFLRAGVPAALSHAALRRAWAADPAISGFVGLAENAWDFNNPNAVPGFGAIGADDVRRVIAQLERGWAPDPEANQPQQGEAEAPPATTEAIEAQISATKPPTASQGISGSAPERNGPHAPAADIPDNTPAVDDATQNEICATHQDVAGPRRSHGGALPT